jgi:hypothetical protein
MPADITVEKDYKVADGRVALSLVIGEGQFGRSDIRLNTQRLLRASGSIGNLFIGKGPDVQGKTLRIRTIVHDTVSATNRMSVTYSLSGGTHDSEFTSKGEVEKEGGNLIFEANVAFT